MKAMTKQVVMGLVFLAVSRLLADTYTWDGGGSTNNWSDGANWTPDGSAPVSATNTTVQLNGSTRTSPVQDIATPFLLNRLEFLGGSTYTAAFTLGGSALQFSANGAAQPRVYLQRNASCTVNNAIEIPAGTTLFAEIGTFGVTLGGAITGGGAIDKQSQAGGLSLNSSANTFSGGLTVRAVDNDWYKVNINASGAMGTGPVSLYGGTLATGRTNPGGLTFYNTTAHTNPISLYQTSPVFAGLPNGPGTVALNGDIDLNASTLHLRGGGAGTVGGVISEGAASAVVKSDAGTWTLAGANTFTGRLTVRNGTLKLGAAGALDPLVGVSLACATGWYSVAYAALDLNGYDQTVSQLDGAVAQAGLTNYVTSAAAATLTVNQSASTLFDGCLSGALSLVKDGAGTLALSNTASTAAGGVAVSNGTLAVVAGARLAGTPSVTVAGGRLELWTASAIADTAALGVADGAKVWVAAGITETVDKLFINGAQQPRGFYGTAASGAMFADDAHFDGTGLVYVRSNPPVTAVDATWDAEGGDTLLLTDANWVGDSRPAFDGTTRVIFGTGGVTATVDTAAGLYGMTFNREGAFTLEAGSGMVSNGMGGILASAPSTASRTYTLAEDLLLADHQTWQVTTNWPGLTTLSVSGPIDDGLLPCDITKTGFGRLVLTASNTFDGVLTVNEGDLNIYHSQALGRTTGNTVVNGGAGGRLNLYGNLSLEEPLVLNGEKNNGGTLLVGSGSNVLSGPLTCYNQVRIQAYNGPLVITGGVTADNNGLFVVNSGSVVTFVGSPVNLGSRTFWSDSGGVSVLAVAGNTWADTMCAGGGIRCEVPDALPPAASLQLGVGYSPNSTLNLNGNNQTVGRLFTGTPNPGTRTITSATPALLTVNQSANSLADARFAGAVSLLKLGAGTLTLTNALTSTTGSFVVSNGTLWVGADGTFGANATNVVVGGTGRLTLTNSVTIADSATLLLPASGVSTAKLDLAAGVNEAVSLLVVGDRVMRAGVYGASGSPAPLGNQDDEHFSGTGVLTVLNDKAGTIIMMR